VFVLERRLGLSYRQPRQTVCLSVCHGVDRTAHPR